MVKKKSAIVETQSGRSKVWDMSLPKGEQHTIYAPGLFFELWIGDDSQLKKHVNDYLVEQQARRDALIAAKNAPVRKLPAKAEIYEISDDDI